MNKATIKAAGTAALGIALAAAAVAPAAAEGLGSTLTALPSGDLPLQSLAGAPLADGTQALNSPSGSVHAVTGTAQHLVNAAAPAVQHAAQTVPALRKQIAATHGIGGLPVSVSGLPGGLDKPLSGEGMPGADPTGQLGGVTGGLPMQAPVA
jgi:hypothetical protein